MKRTLIILMLIFSAALLWGVNLDGKVSKGEYSKTQTYNDMSLHFKVEGNFVYVAVEAKTKGWIAFGWGSQQMDGASMILAYYNNGPEVSLQMGKGHGHGDTNQISISDYSVSEDSTYTTLEFKIAKSDIFDSGSTTISFIAAFGTGDNFVSYHKFRTAGKITL